MHQDPHGLVRTVTVGMRNMRKAAREPSNINKAGLSEITLPVQRLVIVLGAEERWRDRLVEENSF